MDLDRAVLSLLKLRGVGPRSVERIIELIHPEPFRDFHAYLNAASEKIAKIPAVSSDEISIAQESAIKTIERCHAEGIEFLTKWSPSFPTQLKSIPNAPVVLFAIGNTAALNMKGVAVVGTREPTEFGLKSAHRISHRLVENGLTVISGLAEGCDTGGHEGALDAGGITIAVLAHGIGTIYPAANRPLADRILKNKGCLITEYPPGEPAHPTKFVARDRLQCGLANATIVIETDVKGGTMHTVGFTLTQGRYLAAVSHPERLLHEPKTRGNQMLIAERKATPLATSEDLIDFIKKIQASTPSVTVPQRQGTMF